MIMKLIPVRYRNVEYPNGIIPVLREVAGNIDSKPLSVDTPYSLHTEYSYMKRRFDSELLSDLDELKDAERNGIPMLWYSDRWSYEYALFIKRLVSGSIAPEVIELHPPFSDYCADLETFLSRYKIFSDEIARDYPHAELLLEDRCGTMYNKSKFLISKCDDVLSLCDTLKSRSDINLGVVLDYPQLFSAEGISLDAVELDKILSFNETLKNYREQIRAIHLWGKKRGKNKQRWIAHSGDLNSFFSGDTVKKETFIASLMDTFDDDVRRYFVPEVNSSGDDLRSIVNDLREAGVSFAE